MQKAAGPFSNAECCSAPRMERGSGVYKEHIGQWSGERGATANVASINKGVQRNFGRDVNCGNFFLIDGDGGGDSRFGIPKEMESMGHR